MTRRPGSPRPHPLARLLPAVLALVLAACSGPILANEPAERPTPPPTATPAPALPDPQPVVLPRDDGPHQRLTEWWYYTGHLVDTEGKRYGFEFVIFRAERGDFPVSWASHLAVTDENAKTFHYGERIEVGPQVDRSPRDDAGVPTGFDLSMLGTSPVDPSSQDRPVLAMRGANGRDHLDAHLSAGEAQAADSTSGLGILLDLVATKPAALHDKDGWIDFGVAGGSYYYSRTRMNATGQLQIRGQTYDVTGQAWFDHQWGDFISVGAGGWDWFALNLSDGTDITLSLVRDTQGKYPLVYGTAVDRRGRTTHLGPKDFTVEPTGSWTSAATKATYPSGWRVRIPGLGLDLRVTPTVEDQELDTRGSTGVVYWEGSETIVGTRDGARVTGRGYVELTGYAPADR